MNSFAGLTEAVPRKMHPWNHSGNDARERLIVALDYPTMDAALALVDDLQGTCRWFKVGMELYYAAGNTVVEHLCDRGFDVFLDLKLHDIPNTVAGAVRSASKSGAALLTVHASGGLPMLEAATEAAKVPGSPKLLAVTVLTSLGANELNAVGVADSPAAQVLRLARLARQAGIDGFVCSAEEIAAVRTLMGPEATVVIPGIRPTGAALADQSRVATPGEAIAAGASMLVVGRPITRAAEPAAAAAQILREMELAAQG